MIVSVARSPLRLLTMVVVAVPMMLLALDMSVTYRFFPAPATTQVVVGSDTDPETGQSIDITEDVLTLDGEAQRRREVAFSILLGAGGVVLLAWAAKDLVAPKRLIEADEDGIILDVTRRGEPPVRLPWEDVAEIRSGAITDEAGSTHTCHQATREVVIVPTGWWHATCNAGDAKDAATLGIGGQDRCDTVDEGVDGCAPDVLSLIHI